MEMSLPEWRERMQWELCSHCKKQGHCTCLVREEGYPVIRCKQCVRGYPNYTYHSQDDYMRDMGWG